jgi:tetratricopeptide (TPR) repeat protein
VARGRHPRPPEPPAPRAKGWGSVARHGARRVAEPSDSAASRVWREAVQRDRDRGQPPEWEPEIWLEDDGDNDSTGPSPSPAPTRGAPPRRAPGPTGASAAPERTASERTASERPRSRAPRLPEPVRDELGRSNRKLAPKLEQRLAEAVRAYERDRYQDARRILRTLAEQAPDAPAVRELYGLTLYRMNRWAEALKELDAFRALTGSHDQDPVAMDASRALKRWAAVERVWAGLREASPAPDIVAEGRIVAAGALADRGRLADAIGLLERAPTDVKRPRLHHLRTWYALADLYERAGDLPRARALFTTVLRQDADFADVAERLSGLG